MKKLNIILIVVIVLILVIAVYLIRYKNNTLIEDKIVGGCAGVYYPYWNECCDNWANENNIIRIQCVGNWTVENNTCKWECAN